MHLNLMGYVKVMGYEKIMGYGEMMKASILSVVCKP